MGSWFSNLHVRKSKMTTMQSVCDCINAIMAEKKCESVSSAQDADFTVAMLESNDWISVYCDAFRHDDSDTCKAVAIPFSERLNTDVLGISCFDSDFMYLNLINQAEKLDGWIGIGSGADVGIKRRNNLSVWKKKVENYPDFSVAAKQSYICADEFLSTVENAMALPLKYGALSPEDEMENARYLYFRQEEGREADVPKLWIQYVHPSFFYFDCDETRLSFINLGEASCGLSIYFLGPYVEHDEITFTNVRLERLGQPTVDVELRKCQLPDGRWVYFWHDSQVEIPPKVERRLNPKKQYILENERRFWLSYTRHGNPRKMLDITIMILPDKNPENCEVWNYWKEYGSKKAYIKRHNSIEKRVRAVEPDRSQWGAYLKIEDFDDEL